jgi:hypothetical protein
MFLPYFGPREPKPQDVYTSTPSRRHSQRRYVSMGGPTPFFPPGAKIFAVSDYPADDGADTCHEGARNRIRLTRKRSASVGGFSGVPSLKFGETVSHNRVSFYTKPDPELVLAELDCLVNLDLARPPLDLAGFLEMDDIRALHEQDLMDALTKEAWLQNNKGESSSSLSTRCSDTHNRASPPNSRYGRLRSSSTPGLHLRRHTCPRGPVFL